jgi:hypothetical protein
LTPLVKVDDFRLWETVNGIGNKLTDERILDPRFGIESDDVPLIGEIK